MKTRVSLKYFAADCKTMQKTGALFKKRRIGKCSPPVLDLQFFIRHYVYLQSKLPNQIFLFIAEEFEGDSSSYTRDFTE